MAQQRRCGCGVGAAEHVNAFGVMDLRRFSRNVLSLGVSTAVNVVVNLLLLPLVVHAVGRDLYGVYILVMTVTGYFALLDLGVDSSVIKFGAESLGRDDDDTLGRVASNALTFYA